MSYPPNVGAIAELDASREGFILAESILGTVNPQRVFEELPSFCTVRLGASVEDTLFCEVSVGTAFGLGLRDGSRLCSRHTCRIERAASQGAYTGCRVTFFARGFLGPASITGPLPFGHVFATIESFVERVLSQA
jgi:hypothetical protein